MTGVKILAIAAMDQGRVIGCNNEIPWHYSEDFRYFRRLTRGHTVLMGRKTFQSLPEKSRPLPDRFNVVVSRNEGLLTGEEGIYICSSPQRFLSDVENGKVTLPSDQVWIIGGAQVYHDTVNLWQELYLTLVHSNHGGDTWFPEFEDQFELVSSEPRGDFSFRHYVRT